MTTTVRGDANDGLVCTLALFLLQLQVLFFSPFSKGRGRSKAGSINAKKSLVLIRRRPPPAVGVVLRRRRRRRRRLSPYFFNAIALIWQQQQLFFQQFNALLLLLLGLWHMGKHQPPRAAAMQGAGGPAGQW